MLPCVNFDHLNNFNNTAQHKIFMERWKTTKSYLIMLPVGFRVVRVGVVLEELSHVGHDGLLIRFIYVHILRNAAQ